MKKKKNQKKFKNKRPNRACIAQLAYLVYDR